MDAPAPNTHALVIGGSGMLRPLCMSLARSGRPVSVIARRPGPLRAMTTEARELHTQLSTHTADYHDPRSLDHALASAISEFGPVSATVCWIHATAPAALGRVAAFLAGQHLAAPPLLLEVLGSSAADPATLPWPTSPELRSAGIIYRRAILGFIVEHNYSRWLTIEEISNGVLGALTSSGRTTIVGHVQPWHLHP